MILLTGDEGRDGEKSSGGSSSMPVASRGFESPLPHYFVIQSWDQDKLLCRKAIETG